MTTSAKLKIMLTANDTPVAESEDAILWQRVLAAITGAGSPASLVGSTTGEGREGVAASAHEEPIGGREVLKMARELGIEPSLLVGACDPVVEPPYLSLDLHCWEALKKSTPQRGPNAITAMALGATLLCLWFKHAKLGVPRQAQVQAVLRSVGAAEANPTRAIRNCLWLQSRGGGIMINPAQISAAVSVARSFCTKTYADHDSGS